jgi:hypothetical protein
VVGPTAARLGTQAERVDSIGDAIGSCDPALANRAYKLAIDMREAARNMTIWGRDWA